MLRQALPVSAALMERTVLDRRDGRPVNAHMVVPASILMGYARASPLPAHVQLPQHCSIMPAISRCLTPHGTSEMIRIVFGLRLMARFAPSGGESRLHFRTI